jgi:hypothetical protein
MEKDVHARSLRSGQKGDFAVSKQARQGNKVRDIGRRRRSSLGVFGWKLPPRKNLRLRKLCSLKSTAPGRPKTESLARNCRPRYDSDPLRERLRKRGIEIIVPAPRIQAAKARGWMKAAPLQAPLVRRTHQRVARPVPHTLGSTSASPLHLHKAYF